MCKWVVDGILILLMILSILQMFLPKKSGKLKATTLCIIVLTAVSALLLNHLNDVKDILSQNEGVLTPRSINAFDQQDYGTSVTWGSPPTIILRLRGNIVMYPLGRKFPLCLENTKKGLFITTMVRSIDRKIVAKIVRNKWVLNPNNYFRKNFDAHSLEVIDQLGIPILQIDYLNENKIALGGVFFTESVNMSDIDPDFPYKPDNEGIPYAIEVACVAIFGHGYQSFALPKGKSDEEKIRSFAQSSIKPWFDYSDPKKIGIRKPEK